MQRLYPAAPEATEASMARIIFLHGASSSGKSTLARALQDRIEGPFWHISIDDLRDAGVLPTRRFQNGSKSWPRSSRSMTSSSSASMSAGAAGRARGQAGRPADR